MSIGAVKKGARIFIVEDERIIAKDIEATIRSLGYDFLGSASTGEDAVRLIPEMKPDIVLMDINLKGGISGVEAVEQLKPIVDVPVVYLTAYSDEKTLDRAKRTEPYGYILKPYEERELHSTIEMALYKHKTEKQMRYNEKWYRTILTGIGEGVIATDLEGNILFVNLTGLQLLQAEEENIVGKNLDDVFVLRTGNGKPCPIVLNKTAYHGVVQGSPTDVVILKTTGAAELPIDYLVSPINNADNITTSYVVVFRDLSDKIKSEEVLQATEYRYTTIFEAARDVIYNLSLEGKLVSLNKAFVDLTGFPREELIGHDFKAYIHADDLTTAARHFDAVRKGGHPPAHELRVKTSTGEYRYAEITTFPMLQGDQVVSVIGIARDVTIRKQTENELIKAKNLAEQSKKYQEQFLANISHEIRTPMNAILGMSQLLLQSKLSKYQIEFVNAMKLSAENLLVIINDILDLSKIQAGKMTFEEASFNFQELMNGLYNTIQFKINEKKLRFVSVVDHAIYPHLVGDPVRINQILLNLLGNAVKFTDEGEVKIECSRISSGQDTEEIAFVVSDTGIGIPREKFEMIFDNFKQASSDTTRKYGGTGLGLTISKQLVELMGGTISVESTVGKGSRFKVVLKLKKGEQAEDKPAQVQHERNALGPARVLVVEDNNFNKLLIKNVLLGWGADVDMADNGKIGVDKVQSNEYDIVLMDIQMPVMDGYEATEYIRKKLQAPKKDIPILAVTAHATISEKEKCFNAGMNDFVSKPINTDKLFKKIKRLLDKDPGPAEMEKEETLLQINQDLTDLAYLKEISGGNMELMKEMVDIFINETPVMLEGLEKAVKESDWKAFREIAHKIKPSITYAGITSAEALIEKIHENAKSGKDLEDIPRLLPEFVMICRAAIDELKQKVKELV